MMRRILKLIAIALRRNTASARKMLANGHDF
jgi:hypothetical protein